MKLKSLSRLIAACEMGGFAAAAEVVYKASNDQRLTELFYGDHPIEYKLLAGAVYGLAGTAAVIGSAFGTSGVVDWKKEVAFYLPAKRIARSENKERAADAQKYLDNMTKYADTDIEEILNGPRPRIRKQTK